MPIEVRKDITVTQLRPGDRLDETPPALVASLTRRTVWGFVQIAGEPTPRHLRLDTTVTVLRDEPTAEEQAQRRRAVMADLLRAELAGWLNGDPARTLRTIVDTDPGHGEVLTWSNLPGLLRAQATFRQARILCHHLGQPEDLATVDDDTLLEAFATWWLTNIHQVTEWGPRHDPLSRSSSVIANILDDCTGWAVEHIRWRIGCAGARPEMHQRVARMVADHDSRR